MVTLTLTDARYNYLIAAGPVFQAAIDARRQLLVVNGVHAGLKIDFLDAIKESTFPLNRSFTSPSHVSS